jgi:hypothetical protein
MDPDTLIPFAEHTHLDLFSSEVHLNMENALLPDEIFLFYADRRNDDRDAALAKIDGLTGEE